MDRSKKSPLVELLTEELERQAAEKRAEEREQQWRQFENAFGLLGGARVIVEQYFQHKDEKWWDEMLKSFNQECSKAREYLQTDIENSTDSKRRGFFRRWDDYTDDIHKWMITSKDKGEIDAKGKSEYRRLQNRRNGLISQWLDLNRPQSASEQKKDAGTNTGQKAKPEYSSPLPMTKWAIIFGVSENKLRELRKEKKYHFDQISERKWRLPKHEIPAEYLEKYRQAARPRTQ